MFEQVTDRIAGISKTYLMRHDDLMIISAIAFFVLFTFVLYRSRMVFIYKINTFFSSRQIYSSNEVNVSNQEMIDIILLIVIGCISVGIIFYADMIVHSSPHYGVLLLLSLGMMLLIGIKGLLYSLVNWTFFSLDKGRSWLSAFFFSVAIVSTLAFPLSLLKVFCVDQIINVTYCLVGLVILQKIILLCKLYVNFRPKKYGGLLFFLYFCSVEIMPTLIAWKLISSKL